MRTVRMMTVASVVLFCAWLGWLLIFWPGRSQADPDGSEPPGPSFLFIRAPHQTEVFINGQSIAVIERQEHSTGQQFGPRLILHEKGKTHFTFLLTKDDKPLYKPGFDFDLNPGDMLSCELVPERPEANKLRFGPAPDSFSPALSADMPRLECWFGRANARTDCFIVGGNLELEALAAKANHRILKRSSRGEPGEESVTLYLAPPKGKTIVEAILEAESWPGMKYVESEPLRVY